jgi:hypothetical protein
MRLMDGISKVVAKLLDNLLDSIKFLCGTKISNDTLEAADMVSIDLVNLGS